LKTLIKLLLFLLAAILAGLLVARPAIAQAPKSNNYSEIIKEEEFIGPISISTEPVLEEKSIRSNVKQLVRPSTPRPHADSYDGLVYSKEEVIQLIESYSSQYGIHADLPLRIAKCESGYNQFSKNRSSTASGVFQYLNSTWRNTQAGKEGVSVFDAEANIKMAISHIATHGTSPWNASRGCWS
jgi:Transglycosylase SLT domain